jgi:hypothetical protein
MVKGSVKAMDEYALSQQYALMVQVLSEVKALREEHKELAGYVKDLDNKARAMGSPENMEKMLSGMMGSFMGGGM